MKDLYQYEHDAFVNFIYTINLYVKDIQNIFVIYIFTLYYNISIQRKR